MTSKHNPTTTIGSPCTTVRFFPAAAQDAANQLLATYTSGHAITWYVCFILSFLYIAHSRENFLKNSEQQWSRFSWPPLSFHFDQCWHAHQQCTLWCFFLFFVLVMWCDVATVIWNWWGCITIGTPHPRSKSGCTRPKGCFAATYARTVSSTQLQACRKTSKSLTSRRARASQSWGWG